jgi:hypothetical protein
MTEPSTPDTRKPTPYPRNEPKPDPGNGRDWTIGDGDAATYAWPAEPIQVIPVEPSDELRQLRAFRAGIASVLSVASLDHDEIRRSLDHLVVDHGRLTLGVQSALDAIEHLPCVGMCPGRQVDARGEWCSFCTAKQALADALAEVGPAEVHVVHRGGELLHAALDANAARQWATEATQDGLTFTTLEIR